MNDKDLRIKKTKKLLKEALISLLEIKSLDDITVKEICEKASVNRVTFYDHYFDKEELYNSIILEIENDIIKEFKKDSSIYYLDKNYKKLIKKLVDYFYDNRKHFSKVLLHRKNSLCLAAVMHRYFFKYLHKGIRINSDKFTGKEIDNQIFIKSHFISGALVYSFSWWIKEGLDISKEEFFKHICDLLDDLFDKKF